MTIRRCYLIPGPRQEPLVRSAATADDIIIHERDIFRSGPEGLERAVSKLEQVAADGAAVLCLTETAVYVAGLVAGRLNVGFSQNVLESTTKTEMREVMLAAGLPTIPSVSFTLSAADAIPADPPFVIKPDFGFASQLAMRITGETDWLDFLASARDPRTWSARQMYADTLFKQNGQFLDRFVIQPDLSASKFLTLSFAYINGEAVSFITSGTRADPGSSTSFAWRGFSAPSGLPESAVSEIDAELAQMARTIGCRDGVYAAELLWDEAEHWYLEFEPRPQNGLIPDLILHAFGVDVDELAIRTFLGRCDSIPDRGRQSQPTHLGIRRDTELAPVENATLVQTVGRDSAGTALNDEIWCLHENG